MSALSDNLKLPGTISQRNAELSDNLKLPGTISQRNAELAESHQQRRNLEEQLNQIALRNNGLEQVWVDRFLHPI